MSFLSCPASRPAASGLRLDTYPSLLTATSLALSLAFSLSACGKKDEDKTAGQRLDSAIALTEKSATEASVKTQEALVRADVALKEATKGTESSVKQAAGKVGDKLDDMAITATVSSDLAKDPDLSAIKIDVDTSDGVVTLKGSAPTEAARERASRLAKAVQGVHSVENKLVLK